MSATGTITISGSIEDLPGGSKTIGPITIDLTAASGVTTDLVLASGDNTITLPTAVVPTGCIIVFDSTSTTTKKLKGVAGDTGITVKKTGVCVMTFDASPPTNFIINASAADTGKVTSVIFF